MTNKIVMGTPACSVHDIVAEMRQIHMDYQVLWRKTEGMATLSRGEHPDPFLHFLSVSKTNKNLG